MSEHISVLARESLEFLDIQKNDVIIDGTINEGGHAGIIVKELGEHGVFIGLDLDDGALVKAESNIRALNPVCELHFLKSNFKDFENALVGLELESVDKIFLDLGWSMNQFLDESRGFSFMADGPLSMTLDPHSLVTAYDIVNGLSKDEIANIIYEYGEERLSRSIAESIVRMRKIKPISTTFELVDAIKEGVPIGYIKGRTHFATKTFQAIRIFVNHELDSLHEFLDKVIPYLRPHTGRLLIITFHSLEDRIVKHAFRDWKQEGLVVDIIKGGLTPSNEELRTNRRSRSARLRGVQKL